MGQWHEDITKSPMRYTIHKKTPYVRLSLTWKTIIYKTDKVLQYKTTIYI